MERGLRFESVHPGPAPPLFASRLSYFLRSRNIWPSERSASLTVQVTLTPPLTHLKAKAAGPGSNFARQQGVTSYFFEQFAHEHLEQFARKHLEQFAHTRLEQFARKRFGTVFLLNSFFGTVF